MYSRYDNWVGTTHPALVSMYSLPYRYYVPNRIRETYRPRLENAGLWDPRNPEKEEKKTVRDKLKSKDAKPSDDKFHRAFEREKV